MHLQGSDDYGAAAALWSASDTGFTVSGVFRDMADFAVLVLFQKDDPFGHPLFSYLPDGDLTGLVLDFEVTWQGIQSWESLKNPSTDWNTLDYSINGVGHNTAKWIGSATYFCLEDSLNSAGVANNVAGQINARSELHGHHGRHLWQRDLHHLEDRGGRAGGSFEFGRIGIRHADPDNRRYPAIHCAADQRRQLGAERSRRYHRLCGAAEPVGDHGRVWHGRQHGRVLPDGQQCQQPTALHREQLEPIWRFLGPRHHRDALPVRTLHLRRYASRYHLRHHNRHARWRHAGNA